MTNLSCGTLLQISPTISEVKNLYSTYIANCVINSFLSYTAIMLNIVTIHAIRKDSSLPKPLKTLLLSLAVSDAGVGLQGEPFYISLLVRWSQRNIPNCVAFHGFFFPVRLFAIASYFTVVAISVDRFLAIHLHLRYQELVTHKRVVAVVISIWLFSLFVSLMHFSQPRVISIIVPLIGVACLLATTIVYWRIYLVLQRHKNEIQALQIQEVQQEAQNGNMVNFASLRKSAVCLFYVYLVFLACYLPRVIILVAATVQGPGITVKRFAIYSWTLIFLNSSLNPVVYCWKMRHIRHAIMNILRNSIQR
ncbi:adenosine receptor A2b-like [Oculina patagonica]